MPSSVFDSHDRVVVGASSQFLLQMQERAKDFGFTLQSMGGPPEINNTPISAGGGQSMRSYENKSAILQMVLTTLSPRE